jgi:hypothetical protein
MSDQVVYLKPPERTTSVAKATPAVILGRQYQLGNDNLPDELHGMCGGLDYDVHYGRVLPPASNRCFLWDIDDELTSEELQLISVEGETIPLAPNTNAISSRFVLSHSTLSEPQIIDQESTPQLTTTASFQFIVSTSMQAVRLGLLSLVETQRFAQLSNGKRHSLLDSNERPVLYLTDTMTTHDVITPILDTGAGKDSIQHDFDIKLAQAIPARLAGSDIETLTVLEQYTSFFMQRELPSGQDNIWTPVCAPISWGWSMRVAKRQDGDWCIVRQKLLMPTVGHNGLEMPVWEGNQLHR